MMKILITGGEGFIGSYVAEFYARRESDVIVFDDLSRARLLDKGYKNATYNWNYLKRYSNIKLVKGDVADFGQLKDVCKDIDTVIHTAAQTAVTTSLTDPKTDFTINALGTFNILEAARRFCNIPAIIFCSSNKVYGNNINNIKVLEKEKRYIFEDKFKNGIPEKFPTTYASTHLTVAPN